MKRITRLLTISALTVLCGCGAQTKTAKSRQEFYSGSFVYDPVAGDARFTDCATFRTMQVAHNQNVAELIAGNGLSGKDTIPVIIEFTGHRKADGKTDDGVVPGSVATEIIIDSLISVSRETECTDRFTVSGIYESAESGSTERRLLRLRPDYTFELTIFSRSKGMRGDETTISGLWFRTSKRELALLFTETGMSAEYFRIDPERDSIIENTSVNGTGTEYKKVYI